MVQLIEHYAHALMAQLLDRGTMRATALAVVGKNKLAAELFTKLFKILVEIFWRYLSPIYLKLIIRIYECRVKCDSEKVRI